MAWWILGTKIQKKKEKHALFLRETVVVNKDEVPSVREKLEKWIIHKGLDPEIFFRVTVKVQKY